MAARKDQPRRKTHYLYIIEEGRSTAAAGVECKPQDSRPTIIIEDDTKTHIGILYIYIYKKLKRQVNFEQKNLKKPHI